MKNWTRETFDRVVQQLPEMDLDEEDVDYSSDDAIDQPADDSKTEG
jgi:hypothetical protein